LKILLNGEDHETSSATIGALVRELELDRQWVVIEQNLAVPDKSQWDETSLSEGDQVEVVRFLGGG
jgi:thiamine biosynthesis protein ThiS